jgi:hypothetical protein
MVGMMLLLCGCGTAEGLGAAVAQSFSPTVPTDPARDGFGVSAPVEATDAATNQGLDWKVSQMCTNGSDPQQQTKVPAEEGREIAVRSLTCRPYHVSLSQ